MQAKASTSWNVGDVILNLYKVTDTLGQGGFATVYKVRHQGWNIDLAVKKPKPEIVAAAGGIENFEREAETWVNLGLHPHIVSCYYVRRIESSPLVFAEYIAGGSLHNWIGRRKLYESGVAASLQHILDIAIQMAWGLHYAHEQGLIHQDVKPANVMLTPSGVAKVTDLGLANERAIAAVLNSSLSSASNETLRVSGGGGMTPAYCSPEQVNKEILTRRSDVWSWGLSVLEMFQGERTWPIGTLAPQALEDYVQTGPEDPELPQMPMQVAQLLERCFRSNPDERPRTMLEVVSQLKEIYQHLTGEAYPRPEPKAAQDIADSLNNRAVSLLDLGSTKEALQLWQQALSRHPHHPESTYNQGLMLWRSHKITDIDLVRELEAARQSHPEDGIADYLLGLVHLERDDCEAAIKSLESVRGVGVQQEEVQAAQREAQVRVAQSKRLWRTFEGDSKRVNAVCISPDGRYALSGKHDGRVEFWEFATGNCRTVAGHIGEGVQSVSFCSDSRYAVSISNLTLKLWELSTGLELCTFEVNPSATSVLMSPDDCYTLSGSSLTLTLREVATGLELYTFKRGGGSVCISPDGRYALGLDGLPKLWDVASGDCIRTFEGHTKRVNSVCMSPDGRYALSGSDDGLCKLWEVTTGCCVRTFNAHSRRVKSVCFSPDGRYALSGGHLSLRLWSVATGRCLRTFRVDEPINSVCMSPDGRYALSGCHSSLKLWGVYATANPYIAPMRLCLVQATETILSVRQIYEQELALFKMALAQGDAVAAAQHIRKARSQPGYSRDVEAFKAWTELYLYLPRQALRGGWEGATFTGHTSYVNSVVFSADSGFALSGSEDNTLKLWEVATGRCLRTFEGYFQGKVSSVVLSPDGRYALSGSQEGRVKLWEVATGRCLNTFEGKTAGTPAVCFSPDGRYAMSGSNDGWCQLWEVATGRCLRSIQGHQSRVNSVCISSDGRYALSGAGENHSLGEGKDNTVKLWVVATGRCFRTFAGHESGVTSVCLSPDGHYALTGSWDKTLKLWEVATSRCLRTFEGHEAGVTSVCLSFDGRYALSGSWDKTLKLWEVETGRCLRTFEGHTDGVKSVCLSLDGRYALSGSDDGSVKLWVLDWELEDQVPVNWDEGARAYLETFLTLHTPYAASLPKAPSAKLAQPQNEQAKQINGFLLRLFAIASTETVILGVNAIAAGVAAFVAGVAIGSRSGWAGVKFAFWFLIPALGVMIVSLILLPVLSSAYNGAVIDNVWAALSVVIWTNAGAIAGAVFKAISAGVQSKAAANTRAMVLPGATAVTQLKTKFGTLLAVAILILTIGCGISLGLGFKLGFLNPFVISTVLATGLSLKWMMATRSDSTTRWKARVKVGVAAVAIAIVLYSFKWALLGLLGLTPILFYEDINQAREYLDQGGNPNMVNVTPTRKTSLLHNAIMRGNTDVAELLIAKGADVNAKMTISTFENRNAKNTVNTYVDRNSHHLTPLHLAAEKGYKGLTEKLIAKGAEVNAQNYSGETPLHLAVRYHQKDVAELLIAKGADINARNSSGETPLRAVRAVQAMDYKEIVEFLESHGGVE